MSRGDLVTFKYKPDQCDVVDKKALAQFRTKLVEWQDLMTKDEQSIFQQIYRMIWDDAVFRTLNEARRLGAAAPSAGAGFNSALLGLIDRGYVAHQAIAIRRITADENDSNTPVRIAKDIKANAPLLTREMFVSYDGLPFDPAPSRAAWYAAKAAKGGGVSAEWMSLDGPQSWNGSEMAHEHFDRIGIKTGRPPSRGDLIDFSRLDAEVARLKTCSEIRKYANKFIAHAADAKSRSKLTDDERKVTLAKIRECHKVICEVANYIYGHLLNISSSSFLATPQYDQFENLDKPMVLSGDVEKLHAFWDANAEEIEAWK
jgi:hypothetical protein